MKANIEFTRVNNDVNGNPRYVCHFLELLKDSEKTVSNYNLAVKRANKIGGKIYRGKDFGGGIVFQCYNLSMLTERINDLLKTNTAKSDKLSEILEEYTKQFKDL